LLMACLLAPAGPAAAAGPDPDEEVLSRAGVGVEDAALLDFVKKRSVTPDEARIKALVRRLGADDFEAREEASRQLAAVGGPARPYLEAALNDPDAEVVRRAAECLKGIEAGSTGMVAGAAVRLLAKRKPAGAAEALLAYAVAAEGDGVGDAVREALASLALRDGKADPALVAGLADNAPARRAAAGHALAPAADQRDAVRKLLKDPEPSVRLTVGLALTRARDKEAVPALIALLEEPALKRPDRGRVETLLYRLAAGKVPAVPPGTDAAGRRKYREAWEAWWKEAGPGLEAAKLEDASRNYGYTLVVLLDRNLVMELDGDNKSRLRFEDVQFPLDAQLLPNEHLLAAEHNSNLVTERDRTGKVVWKHPAEEPIVAQRLPNGNTFIATHTRAFEVDAGGKEVWSYNPRGGENLMRAQKLPDGNVALVMQLGTTRFVVLDKDNKEVRSFGVDVRTSGGRIDVLPNGNVLIPENGNNRVVEFDAKGNVVWEVQVDQPIAALRLPNGNTLITTMLPDLGAIEVDPAGKRVWQYKTDTRVTRAIRR
jgi:HEAT repeat protein